MPVRTQVVSTGYTGAPGYNNFYGLTDDEIEIDAWFDALAQLWQGLQSVLANGTTWACDGVIEHFDISTGQTTAVENRTAITGTGSWGTNKAPGGTALLLRWRTGIYANGRELRGRSYISGIGDFGDSAGAVPSSIVTDAQAAMNSYVGDPAAAVYSPTNADMASIQSGTPWNKFGLIRSRRD